MNEKKGLSGSTIKIIAIVSMLIDHAAAIVLARILMMNGLREAASGTPEQLMQWLTDNGILYYTYSAMRMIGRLGFPIFCFLLIEGFQKTRDVKKYAIRLGLFALVSEIPFDLALKGKILEFSYQNVYFTLFIGLLTMIAFRYIEEKKSFSKLLKALLNLAALGAGAGAAALLRTDYSWIGIICIMAMYVFRLNKVRQIIAGCIVFLWEITAPLAFIPIGFYNGKRGISLKYIFYIFYPAHLLILYIIAACMGMGGIPAV